MNTDNPLKDSYDYYLEFSRITQENWLAADRKNYMPFGVPKEAWAAPFLEARLDGTVPRDVVRVFEVARGSMIYSWFFYPMATLGLEQCTRIAEFAARARCSMLQQESEQFSANLRTLVSAGVISGADETRWQAIRQMRNDRSHLANFMLTDPGEAISILNTTAELINRLFATPAKDWVAEWDKTVAKYLDEVWMDWQGSRDDFPKNICKSPYWPMPFFGDPAKALVATVGVNPSAGEFKPDRGWSGVRSNDAWASRLRKYFRQTPVPHRWFEPWRIGLALLWMSYEAGTATHFDVSYRPTTAMSRNNMTDPVEFREMVERDVKWLFKLLKICPRLRMLLICMPIRRSDGSPENLAQFIRNHATQNGFAVSRDGLLEIQTGRPFFIEEVATNGEGGFQYEAVNHLYARRQELRRLLR